MTQLTEWFARDVLKEADIPFPSLLLFPRWGPASWLRVLFLAWTPGTVKATSSHRLANTSHHLIPVQHNRTNSQAQKTSRFPRGTSFTNIGSHTVFNAVSASSHTSCVIPVWLSINNREKETTEKSRTAQQTISALEQRNRRKTKGFYLLQLFRQKELSELLPGLI